MLVVLNDPPPFSVTSPVQMIGHVEVEAQGAGLAGLGVVDEDVGQAVLVAGVEVGGVGDEDDEAAVAGDPGGVGSARWTGPRRWPR
ncbi:hypothetical protein DYH09_30155 [bacterium CPR1]|nr:hypothetical protein [bacterium CPR1]